MSDSAVQPEVVNESPTSDSTQQDDRSDTLGDAVTEPAKVMRIGSMVKQLLEEVRQAPLDERSRERLAEVYERSVTEPGTEKKVMGPYLPRSRYWTKAKFQKLGCKKS